MSRKLLTVLSLLIIIFSTMTSFADTLPAGPIRVGLKYGSVTNDKETIVSESGFNVTYLNGENSVMVYDLSDYRKLVAEKDDAYHIQVGGTYASFDDALDALEAYEKKDNGTYPAYDDGWKIYYGSYSNQSGASSDLSKVKSKYGSATSIATSGASFVRIQQEDGTVEFIYASEADDFYLKPVNEDGIAYYASKGYRGGIGFKRFPNSVLTVINYVLMDDYLYGVLPKEMSGDWPLEALKAQAIAARNFALINFGKHSDYGFDICSSSDCQVYGGYDVEKSRSNQAVDETSGKLLKYNGQIVQTYYHSNSGGRTESIENIWSGSLPYIVGVYDPYSENVPNSDWELTYTKSEIESILANSGNSVGTLKNVRIEEVSENGRVQKLVFEGTSGKATFLKEKARALFGYTTLKSMWFELGNKPMVTVVSRSAYNRTDLSSASYVTENGIEKSSSSVYVVTDGQSTEKLSFSSDKIVFSGHGYGHGLGMSQWGAKTMAEQGFDFEEILTHYYKDTEVE